MEFFNAIYLMLVEELIIRAFIGKNIIKAYKAFIKAIAI